MNVEKEADYRRALWDLIYKGYSIKNLLKVLKMIQKEEEGES